MIHLFLLLSIVRIHEFVSSEAEHDDPEDDGCQQRQFGEPGSAFGRLPEACATDGDAMEQNSVFSVPSGSAGTLLLNRR